MKINNLNLFNFLGKKINVLIYNDLHGATKNLNSFSTAQDEFYKQNEGEANLTLSGGDVFVDESLTNDIVAQKLCSKTDAIAVGNHDIEGGGYLSGLINKFNLKGKFLSSNIIYKKQTQLSKDIFKSNIIEKNGMKIGVIGISPFDFKKLSFVNKKTEFIDFEQIDKAIVSVKNEVEKLKEQKADIIFLLAHTGEFSPDQKDNYYNLLANIDGINVIVGGHDHRQVDRWFINSSGEPVKIISTGQSPQHYFEGNLDVVAKLNLEIDSGVLEKDKCSSEFEELENAQITDDSEVLYELDEPLVPSKPVLGHCEIANIIADSNLYYANKHTKNAPADFAFVNSGTIRGNFDKNEVTKQDIQTVVPFTSSELVKTNLSKKQIINTLNWCAKSTSFAKISPGLMQVSGLEYTVKPDLTVCDVHILDDEGNIKYNLDDFDDDDCFSAVYDVFLMTGVTGLKDLKKDWENDPEIKKEIEFFRASRQVALGEYLSDNADLKDYKTTRIKT